MGRIIGWLCVFSLTCGGCATPERTDEAFLTESPESQAPGAAYTGEAMNYRKKMPSRPNWRPLEFYYKHCSQMGEGSYYSKTAYECTGPY